MSEQTNQDNANANDEANKGNEEQQEQKGQKTFSQEAFDASLNRALKEKEAKLEKKLADTLKQERADWERQSKLSEEQRAEEQRKAMESELSEKERNLALRENRADARELLIEKNIDSNLVDFVVDVDADKTKSNINELEKAYALAVKAGVDKALAGTTPKDPTKQNDTPRKPSGSRTF